MPPTLAATRRRCRQGAPAERRGRRPHCSLLPRRRPWRRYALPFMTARHPRADSRIALHCNLQPASQPASRPRRPASGARATPVTFLTCPVTDMLNVLSKRNNGLDSPLCGSLGRIRGHGREGRASGGTLPDSSATLRSIARGGLAGPPCRAISDRSDASDATLSRNRRRAFDLAQPKR